MWSAIHLNIPSRSWARWQWAEKCKWLIWGMCFPEIILFQALKQNVLANFTFTASQRFIRAKKKLKGWRNWFKLGRSQQSHPRSGQTTQTEPRTRYRYVSNLLDVEVRATFTTHLLANIQPSGKYQTAYFHTRYGVDSHTWFLRRYGRV
jgi:hypothetical protein